MDKNQSCIDETYGEMALQAWHFPIARILTEPPQWHIYAAP
jgi:hypothetical protein